MRDRYVEAVDWVEQALNLPGADADPALRVRALRTKAMCLWRAGRGAEQPAAVAEMEAVARRLDDPVTLSQALQSRVITRSMPSDSVSRTHSPTGAPLGQSRRRRLGDRRSVPRKGDRASSVADLRERVDTAASLLTDVGNIHELANLLTAAA